MPCGTLQLVVPNDVDAVIDLYIARNQNDRDPYWTRPWQSALALCDHLARHPDLVASEAVCDLGAGLGVAGLGAMQAGAASVMLLDREPLAVECALLSAAACGHVVTPMSDSSDPTRVVQLPGSLPLELQTELTLEGQQQPQRRTLPAGIEPSSGEGESGSGGTPSSSGAVQGAVFDWSDPYTGPRYDVVILCDVLYEEASVQPLAAVLPAMLAADCRVILADPPRRTPANRAAFLSCLAQEVENLVVQHYGLLDGADPIDGSPTQTQIIVLSRSTAADSVGVKLDVFTSVPDNLR